MTATLQTEPLPDEPDRWPPMHNIHLPNLHCNECERAITNESYVVRSGAVYCDECAKTEG